VRTGDADQLREVGAAGARLVHDRHTWRHRAEELVARCPAGSTAQWPDSVDTSKQAARSDSASSPGGSRPQVGAGVRSRAPECTRSRLWSRTTLAVPGMVAVGGRLRSHVRQHGRPCKGGPALRGPPVGSGQLNRQHRLRPRR
jgi:hypothetical protein